MLSINKEKLSETKTIIDEQFSLCEWFPALIVEWHKRGGPVPYENGLALKAKDKKDYYTRRNFLSRD